jgi:lipopolysaccharide/colanic/teichoic acid biosynthesis glycosyltransferase
MTVDRPAIVIETRPLAGLVRRTLDLLVVAAAAPIVVPLVAVLALLVRFDSAGPAFVRISRPGRDGRPFPILKLRTMVRDAEQMKAALQHLNELPWPDFKITDDPRVTRVGRWLRRHSLDELPQLFNVLLGQMTLVGPRPCSVRIADYDVWQTERLDAMPGIAGRWQADGRGALDFTGRCRLDIAQLQARSFRAGLRLLIASARSVLVSKGAC